MILRLTPFFAEVRDWADSTRCDFCQAPIVPVHGRVVLYHQNAYGKRSCEECKKDLTGTVERVKDEG